MKLLPLKTSPARDGNKKGRGASPLRFFWMLSPISLAAAVLVVLASGIPYNKAHTIEDASYVQQLSRRAVPESLTLLDSVWGSIIIGQPEKVLACYDLLTRLPYEEKGGESIGRIRNRELSGSINFSDRSNIHFSIYDSVVVDGIAYGGAAIQSEASFLVHELCEDFYTPESLGRLIDRYTRIVLRTDNSRVNLSTTVKKQLKDEIQSCTLLRSSEQLSSLLRGRGKALCQIEIYADDNRTEVESWQSPKVYVAVYGNGLCVVYDVDNSVGSDMHLFGELPSIFSILED